MTAFTAWLMSSRFQAGWSSPQQSVSAAAQTAAAKRGRTTINSARRSPDRDLHIAGRRISPGGQEAKMTRRCCCGRPRLRRQTLGTLLPPPPVASGGTRLCRPRANRRVIPCCCSLSLPARSCWSTFAATSELHQRPRHDSSNSFTEGPASCSSDPAAQRGCHGAETSCARAAWPAAGSSAGTAGAAAPPTAKPCGSGRPDAISATSPRSLAETAAAAAAQSSSSFSSSSAASSLPSPSGSGVVASAAPPPPPPAAAAAATSPSAPGGGWRNASPWSSAKRWRRSAIRDASAARQRTPCRSATCLDCWCPFCCPGEGCGGAAPAFLTHDAALSVPALPAAGEGALEAAAEKLALPPGSDVRT